jgi:hypothetical protein
MSIDLSGLRHSFIPCPDLRSAASAMTNRIGQTKTPTPNETPPSVRQQTPPILMVLVDFLITFVVPILVQAGRHFSLTGMVRL